MINNNIVDSPKFQHITIIFHGTIRHSHSQNRRSFDEMDSSNENHLNLKLFDFTIVLLLLCSC